MERSFMMKRLLHEMQAAGYTWFKLSKRDIGYELEIKEDCRSKFGSMSALSQVALELNIFRSVSKWFCSIHGFEGIETGTWSIPKKVETKPTICADSSPYESMICIEDSDGYGW